MLKQSLIGAGALIFACAAPVPAAEPEAPATKVRYAPIETRPAAAFSAGPAARPADDEAALVFSAPPRESLGKANELYQPIAQYLSEVLKRPVSFRYADNWLTYQAEMRKGSFDIVFDGPHFNGWRAANLQHSILAKLPGEHVFVVITRGDNERVGEIRQLYGRRVCAMDPSNLGTLTLLGQFDNPARQPVLVNTDGWENIYQGVMARKCEAGVLPLSNLQQYGTDAAKIIFRGEPLPNQAFSAGPRLSPSEQAAARRALLSPSADAALAALRRSYAFNGGLLRPEREEYASMGPLLKDIWGYAY